MHIEPKKAGRKIIQSASTLFIILYSLIGYPAPVASDAMTPFLGSDVIGIVSTV